MSRLVSVGIFAPLNKLSKPGQPLPSSSSPTKSLAIPRAHASSAGSIGKGKRKDVKSKIDTGACE